MISYTCSTWFFICIFHFYIHLLHFEYIFWFLKTSFFTFVWFFSIICVIDSYILIVPVDSALVSHSRSLSLNGSRTRLTPWPMSTALSGYIKWCVVRFPTSLSYPRVTALFILRRREEDMRRRKRSVRRDCVCVLHVYVCLFVCDCRRTGSQNRGSRSTCHVQTVAGCQSCRPLHTSGNATVGDWNPQWVEKLPGTSPPSLPPESGRFLTAAEPAASGAYHIII